MPIDFNKIAKQVEEKVMHKIAQMSAEEKDELLRKLKEKSKNSENDSNDK